jgi:pimeloyl-ACP methyl ester carboxylesterase
LRSYLKSCNFAVHDWDLGVNRGPEGVFDEWLAPLIERVHALQQQHGQRVSLVGWSLGGVYAREIAKLHPDAVRQVVTLATPFNSLSGANHAGTIFKMLGGDTTQLTPELQARLSATPPVPTTSIFSKSDGIVSWRGCLEQVGPRVENVPVQASHIGMPSHPEVFRILADRLAQPEGAWRPYSRRRAAAPGTRRR